MSKDGDPKVIQRLQIFDFEAKAAIRKLEQIRQIVIRFGTYSQTDFEDVSAVQKSCSSLLERLRKSTISMQSPKVYMKGPLGPPAGGPKSARGRRRSLEEREQRPIEIEVSEEVAEGPRWVPLFDLVRQVKDVPMPELCRSQLADILGDKNADLFRGPDVAGPLTPSPPSTASRRRGQTGAWAAPGSPQNSTASISRNGFKRVGTANSETGPLPKSGTSFNLGPVTPELLVEVSLELSGKESRSEPLQEMLLEMQVIEPSSRTSLRPIAISEAGHCGSVALEVSNLKRAELCFALVKEMNYVLGEGLFNCHTSTKDVVSALRVPVSQLLSACRSGSCLEWEADGDRTIVVRGKLTKGASEFFPGDAPKLPSTPTAIVAGRGAVAAEALKARSGTAGDGSLSSASIRGGSKITNSDLFASYLQEFSTVPQAAQSLPSRATEAESSPVPAYLCSMFARVSKSLEPPMRHPCKSEAMSSSGPHQSAAQVRKPQQSSPVALTVEEEKSASAAYIRRLLLRIATSIKKRALQGRSSGSRPTTPNRARGT